MAICNICDIKTQYDLLNCNNCKLHCCGKCYDSHLKECNKLREFKYHLCKQHLSQLEGYCLECTQMTCGRCRDTDHRDHNILSTKLAVDSVASEIGNVSRDINTKDAHIKKLTDTRVIKSDLENKVKNAERKWQSLVSSVKTSLLSEVAQKFKRSEDQKQELHHILNEAKTNLDYLRKEVFPIAFLSKWMCITRNRDLYLKRLKQHEEDIANLELMTSWNINVVFRSRIINFDGMTVDSLISNQQSDVAKITELLAGTSISENQSLANEALQGSDIVHENYGSNATQLGKDNKNDSVEIEKLSNSMQNVLRENERMQQRLKLYEEEQSYVWDCCKSMKELSAEIEERTAIRNKITVERTKNAEKDAFAETIEIVFNRFIETKNDLIKTREQLQEKIESVIKWTDDQTNESEKDRKKLNDKIKKQKSQISHFENELRISLGRIGELQTSVDKLMLENGKLRQACNSQKTKYPQADQLYTLLQENDILKTRSLDLEKTLHEREAEIEYLRRSVQNLKVQILSKDKNIESMEKEKNDLQLRLSSVAGEKLTKGNPEITDLGDPNRPMKIGEKYGELYDNEWTDVLDCKEIKMMFPNSENNYIEECCYTECLLLSQEQVKILDTTIKETLRLGTLINASAISSIVGWKEINTLRRKTCDTFVDYLLENQLLTDKISANLDSNWLYAHKNGDLMKKLMTTQFFQKCVHLCWCMVIQDPVLYLSDDLMPDTLYDKSIYKEFVTSGDKVRYVVWPALFLHKSGPILYKGVVNAYS